MALFLCGALFLPSLVLGQTPAPVPQTPAYEPIKLGPIKFSGSLRMRTEVWDFYDTDAAEPNYAYFASLLRLGLSQETSKLDWQLEFAQPWLQAVPEKSIAPAPQGQLGLGSSYFAANANGSWAAGLFVKQGFVRFKGIAGDNSSSLRLGRFEVIDGSETTPKDSTLAWLKRERIAHRLVGNFAFSHVMRSFDGAQFVRNTPGTNITVVGSRATQGVFQVDGWKELDTDILYGAVTRSVGQKASGEYRVFALSYHDGRDILKTDSRSTAARKADHHNIRVTTLGGNWIQTYKVGAGTLDTLVWGAGQFGSWGVLEQRSGAVDAEAGYQPKLKLRPWLRAGYFWSSGDSNPNDHTHGTFFQVLPTPRIYARFPFYNLMNSQDGFAEFIVRPHPKWTMRTTAHFLRLSDRHDLWYSGGGAFQPTTFGYTGRTSNGNQGLANVYDLGVDYQVNPRLTLSGYYGASTGRTVIAKIFPKGASGQMGFAELNWRF